MTKTLDEAMRRAGEIYNAYAGRRADDPMGADVARKIAASLAADGWPLVPREATLDMCQAAHEAMFEEPWNGTNEGVGAGIAAAIAAAPKTGETT